MSDQSESEIHHEDGDDDLLEVGFWLFRPSMLVFMTARGRAAICHAHTAV